MGNFSGAKRVDTLSEPLKNVISRENDRFTQAIQLMEENQWIDSKHRPPSEIGNRKETNNYEILLPNYLKKNIPKSMTEPVKSIKGKRMDR